MERNNLCNLSYLAGIVDGEGCVGFHSAGAGKSPRFMIAVKMTDEPLIDWLVKNFGGNKSYEKPAKDHYRPQWRWKVQNTAAKVLYRKLRPLLRIKNALVV